VTSRALLRALLLALAAAASTACSRHRAHVGAFDQGRETRFFREQIARARAPAPESRPDASSRDAPASSLGEAGERWVRRVEERDDFAGILDLAGPVAREAFEAGRSAEATESLLAKGPLALETVRGLVAARSPRVREARESWRAAVEQFDQARWLEEVSAAYRGFDARVGSEGPGAMAGGLSPWPAASALRGEMADLESAMAREQARMALVAALADAEEAFAAAWEAGERARVLDGFLRVQHDTVRVAAARYAAGRGRQDEALLAEAESRRLESDLAAAKEQRNGAAARLNALLDRAPAAPLPPFAAPALPRDPPEAASVVSASAASPEVGMAERALDLSRVAVRMAEVMGHPLPGASGRPGSGAAEAAPGEMGMAGGGTSGPPAAMPSETATPWYGIEEAYLRELRRRASAAEAARDAARREAEAAAREAWRGLDAGLRELRVAEDASVPLAEQAFEVSRRDYETGAAGFAEHVRSWEALVRARLAVLAARRMAVEARAAILRATAVRIGE